MPRSDGTLVLNLSAASTTVPRSISMRASIYSHRDIRWNYRYRDITSSSPDGRLLLDYSLFHEVMPEEA